MLLLPQRLRLSHRASVTACSPGPDIHNGTIVVGDSCGSVGLYRVVPDAFLDDDVSSQSPQHALSSSSAHAANHWEAVGVAPRAGNMDGSRRRLSAAAAGDPVAHSSTREAVARFQLPTLEAVTFLVTVVADEAKSRDPFVFGGGSQGSFFVIEFHRADECWRLRVLQSHAGWSGRPAVAGGRLVRPIPTSAALWTHPPHSVANGVFVGHTDGCTSLWAFREDHNSQVSQYEWVPVAWLAPAAPDAFRSVGGAVPPHPRNHTIGDDGGVTTGVSAIAAIDAHVLSSRLPADEMADTVDGMVVLTGTRGGSVHFWDDACTLLHSVPCFEGRAVSKMCIAVASSRRRSRSSSGDDASCCVIVDMDEGQHPHQHEQHRHQTRRHHSAAVTVWVGSVVGELCVLDATSGGVLHHFGAVHQRPVCSLTAMTHRTSGNGSSCSDVMWSSSEDGTTIGWCMRTFAALRRLPMLPGATGTGTTSMTTTPPALSQVVVAATRMPLQLWWSVGKSGDVGMWLLPSGDDDGGDDCHNARTMPVRRPRRALEGDSEQEKPLLPPLSPPGPPREATRRDGDDESDDGDGEHSDHSLREAYTARLEQMLDDALSTAQHWQDQIREVYLPERHRMHRAHCAGLDVEESHARSLIIDAWITGVETLHVAFAEGLRVGLLHGSELQAVTADRDHLQSLLLLAESAPMKLSPTEATLLIPTGPSGAAAAALAERDAQIHELQLQLLRQRRDFDHLIDTERKDRIDEVRILRDVAADLRRGQEAFKNDAEVKGSLLGEARDEISRLKSRVQELSALRDVAREEVSVARSSAEATHVALLAKQVELDELKLHHQRVVAALEADKRRLQDDLAALRGPWTAMKQLLQDAQTETQTLRREVQELQLQQQHQAASFPQQSVVHTTATPPAGTPRAHTPASVPSARVWRR